MSIMLKNVRLSFPSLWVTEKFGGEDTDKYAASFILDKEIHKKEIAEIQKVVTEGYKELKVKSLPSAKLFIKDGDELGRPEYEGAYVVKAASRKRCTVIDRDKTPLAEDDGKPYSGCYVNAIIDTWLQDNSYGKRINGNLLGVQFSKDGEPFGTGQIDVTDDFEELEALEDGEAPF